jgi:hypothetical protein
MSGLSSKEDPRFNGRHVCPRCGSDSIWRAFSPEPGEMIGVFCEGDCGEYLMSYGQLMTFCHFKHDPV